MARLEVDSGFFLNVDIEGYGPPVVLLHGFTGSSTGWDALRELLNAEFTTYAIDIVGHGGSDKPPAIDRYLMTKAAEDLMRVAVLAGAERAAWMGYSMGARTALHVAANGPGEVRCLTLIGGSPGLATKSERETRIASDGALAERIERDGIGPFVDFWESIPLFASQQRLPEDVRARIRKGRLANDPVGLANSLRGMGTGAQAQLFDKLKSLHVPMLLLAGEEDPKFMAIGREVARTAPDATFKPIPEAGHAAQVENPQSVADQFIPFLRQAFQQGDK